MKKTIFSLILVLITVTAFSQLSLVNTGTAPNSGNGDNIRVAFTKTNANDQYLNERIDSIGVLTQPITLWLCDRAASSADTSDVTISITTDHPLAGKNLVQLDASWGKSYGSATVTMHAQRYRNGTWVNMTSTGATLTGISTATTAAINTSNDDLAVGDKFRLISTMGAGTAPYELSGTIIAQ